MPKVSSGRRRETAAVNALRALLESQDHIVQDIDQRNDFGEDLYVQFTEGREVTGDVIKVQVKGGTSWRRVGGYGVPVKGHAAIWADGNIPVICVVHDPKTERLYWANATEQLLAARRELVLLKSIFVSEQDVLDMHSLDDFVAETRMYVNRYRGNQAMRTQLSEMSGAEFDPSDVVLHFINEHGEDIVFWQCRGEGFATLLHSDLGWVPEYVGPEMLRFERFESQPGLGDVPVLGETILNHAEALWVAACFAATSWARQPAPDRQHADIRADVADNYVQRQILRRLSAEPDLLVRSAAALRVVSHLEPDMADELSELEGDADVVEEALEASRETWSDMSFEAKRLVILYLVDRIVIGAPTDPIDRQIRITWRVPRQPSA
ncbi:DUF4365 domain-containing protein [Catellatospora citrea]|uniref:DUF4365 domain-containing protein n=1 Tax=Catellatospora citrea TaxID=53366 RepID=A0A8J3KLN6_9ACTN|nr:DUF4365 domain-containing protein [Catellatospora citrea]RKE05863.1 uncharacterized protein DUF4365 [Catellatospora citrea]GIF97524.1 hypothetical protein Cci01nite_26180 [Catellatospora citrea]